MRVRYIYENFSKFQEVINDEISDIENDFDGYIMDIKFQTCSNSDCCEALIMWDYLPESDEDSCA